MAARLALLLALALAVATSACGGKGSPRAPVRFFSSEPLGSCTYTGTGNGQQVFVIENWTKAQCDAVKGVWTPYG